MECHEVRIRIGSYLDEVLQDLELQEVQGHLKRCSKCAVYLEQLKEIEKLVSPGLYELPSEEYWQRLPQTISYRVGLRSGGVQEKPDRVSLLDSLAGFFMMPQVRWGLAGGLALLLIILLVDLPNSNMEVPVSQNTSVSGDPSSERDSGMPTDESEVTAPLPGSEQKERLAGNSPDQDVQPEADEVADISPSQRKDIVAPSLVPDENTVAKLSGKSPQLNKGDEKRPRFEQELVPLPAPDMTVDDGTSGENQTPDKSAGVSTLSLNANAGTQNPMDNSVLQKEFGFENSFIDVKQIVDESVTLDEKKNIWLSYISREPNSTYRTLATYHLALVLYDIAEQSGEFNDAKDAFDFFRKHESSLREQIGGSGFEARLNALDLIMLE